MTSRTPPTCGELRELFERIYPAPRQTGAHRTPREQNRTRMERALSWLQRCEDAGEEELDERFLFLWIAFNAAYGDDRTLKGPPSPGDLATPENEYQKLRDFLGQIVERDTNYHLADMLHRHKDQLAALIDNRFLYNYFWKAEYQPQARAAWERRFNAEKRRAHAALDDRYPDTAQTCEALCLTFDRLYTLRNQVLHGAASWRDPYNRSSLESGNTILGLLVPEILQSMLRVMDERPDTAAWGAIAYPPYLETPDDTTRGPPASGRRGTV